VFPGVDCVSQTAGNNSAVTEEPIVLPDLLIISDKLFIAFGEDCLNVNFLKMVNRIGGGGLGHFFSIPQCFLRPK
jgi:hypothetical protein